MTALEGPTGGTLWLVATPIGNLADLQPRAVEILASVDVVCCEDTRRTGMLLRHAGIRANRLAICNEHTEYALTGEVIDLLTTGCDVAVVSDAGTPGVSDPGQRLVAAAVDAGHRVSAVPGPSAAVMALVVSGLPTDRFVFEGFLPRKGRERSERLAEIAAERRTVVIYESPRRVVATMADLASACGDDRQVSVSRELTKVFEETIRGTAGDIDLGEPRGEYVVVIGPCPDLEVMANDGAVAERLDELIGAGASTKDAARAVADETGRSRRDLYEMANARRRDRRRPPDEQHQVEPGAPGTHRTETEQR